MFSPKGPCRYMVGTWALKGLLYHDFGAYVCTIVVLGPFGFPKGSVYKDPSLQAMPPLALVSTLGYLKVEGSCAAMTAPTCQTFRVGSVISQYTALQRTTKSKSKGT